MFHSLRKQFAKYVLRFTLYIRTTIKVSEPLADLELIANSINPLLFEQTNGNKKYNIVLNSPFNNIDEVIILLKNINSDIKLNRSISHRLIFNEYKSVNLTNFFSSIDGYYVDVVNSVQIFKLTLLETVTLLKPFIKEESGVQAHNVRVLFGFNKILTNLCLDLFKLVL